MLFSRSFLLALVSAPFAVLAQNSPNGFTFPVQGSSITAGQSTTLTWTPTTNGTVTLVLRYGASSDLNQGNIIASSVDNSGSYTWTPSSSLVRGSDYTIQIIDDSDPSETNYSAYFVLDSTNTVSTPLSTITLPTATSSPSAFPLQSGITLDTSAHHSSTHSASANSASSTTGASTTGSSSSTGTASSSATSSGSMTTSTHATTTTSNAAGLVASSTPTNAGARATAMVGMLGAVALGALAL